MRLYKYYGVCYASNPPETATVIDVMFFPTPPKSWVTVSMESAME